MGVPKHRGTKSQRNQRRMHIFLQAPSLIKCPKCGKPTKPHIVCGNCGYYKGREVVDVLAKLERKERKKKQEELKQADKAQQKEKPLTMEELSRKKF